MTDLLALADEIVVLTCPSREMDARIWVALFGGKHIGAPGGLGWVTRPMGMEAIPSPPLTASIDAAYALLREVLPGREIDIACRDNANGVTIWTLGKYIRYHQASAPTLPLAICAAVVRAVAAREDGSSTATLTHPA